MSGVEYLFGMLLLIFLSDFKFVNSSEKNYKLLSVIDIFRHGARSPIMLDHQNKDYFNVQWNGKCGSLTDYGKRQQFESGYSIRQYLKQNKIDLNKDNVFMISTNVERTIESAYSRLKGLLYNSEYYSSKGNLDKGNLTDIMLNDLKYSTKAVLVEPSNTPLFNADFEDNCAGLDNEDFSAFIEKLPNSAKTKLDNFVSYFKKDNMKLINTLNKNLFISDGRNYTIAGFKSEHEFIELIGWVADHYMSIKYSTDTNAKKAIDWLSQEDIKELEDLDGFYKTIILLGSDTRIKINSFLFFNKIKKDLNDIKHKNNSFVYYGYSLHDFSLGYYLKSLSLKFELDLPTSIHFCSSLRIEAREKIHKDNDIIIYFIFNDKKLFETSLLHFNQFIIEFLYNEKDFESFCEHSLFSLHNTYSSYIIILFLLVAINLILVVMLYKLKKRQLKIEDSGIKNNMIEKVKEKGSKYINTLDEDNILQELTVLDEAK